MIVALPGLFSYHFFIISNSPVAEIFVMISCVCVKYIRKRFTFSKLVTNVREISNEYDFHCSHKKGLNIPRESFAFINIIC